MDKQSRPLIVITALVVILVIWIVVANIFWLLVAPGLLINWAIQKFRLRRAWNYVKLKIRNFEYRKREL